MRCAVLGQVGELMSAVGRRTRLAMEELRVAAAAAAEGGLWRRPVGRSATWLATVAHDALLFARSCMIALCLQQLQGAYPEGEGLTECGGGGPERAGPAAAAEGGPAAAAGAGEKTRAGAGFPGQPERHAVRASIAMAELLPVLARGVVVCAAVVESSEGQGAGRERQCAGEGAGVEPHTLTRLLDCAVLCATTTLACISLAFAKHGGVVMRQQQQQAAAAAAGGCSCDRAGKQDGGGAVGDGGGGVAGGDGAAGEWRQLLLRDVPLIKLLGAALTLHARGTAAVTARLPGASESLLELGPLGRVLVHVLCQTACTFPAELRSAVGYDGEGEVQPQAQTAAAAAATTTAAGQGSLASSSRHGQGSTPPCIPLAAIEALTQAAQNPAAGGLVAHALERGALPSGRMWDEAQAYLQPYGVRLEEVSDALRGLLPPAEARAAVAADAAAVAAGV